MGHLSISFPFNIKGGVMMNITNENLQEEYNYILAEQILKKMLVSGLITNDEYNKISALNKQSFSSVLAEIM